VELWGWGISGRSHRRRWNGKGKVTRRERFLGEMEAVIPWPRLVRLIEAHYPKAGQGRRPLGLEKMLRIYFLQQWFNLSDTAGGRRDLRQ
jgi:IS5 family transposase